MKRDEEQGRPLTYAGSGVNVELGEIVVANLRDALRSTWNDRIIPEVAGFKAVFDDGEYYMIGATDGVGTKLLVGIMAERIDTVGQDLAAMVLNDVVRVGALPLFFLDYMATGKLDADSHLKIVSGIAAGCRKAGVPLLGGETAELPGMYKAGDFDLAGFAIGRIRKDKIIDGKKIKKGATVLGLESSGLHSNGYSLARKVFFEVQKLEIHDYVPELGQHVSEVLLEPTKIYVKTILDLVNSFPDQIQGMAHITGGGMTNKLPKALPEGLGALIEHGSWPIHPIFSYIQQKGPVALEEMRKTFNMGIGMVLVVNDSGAVPDLQAKLLEMHNLKSYQIGKVVEGKGVNYIM